MSTLLTERFQQLAGIKPLYENVSTKVANSLNKLTKTVGDIKIMNDNERSYLVGLGLAAIEQTKEVSPKIKELIENLLTLKNTFEKGTSLNLQSEEVKAAVDYLNSKEALDALKLVTDIEEGMEAALAAGRALQGGSTEKIYTATSFPDGLTDSEFYKKATADGWKFILKPYLGNRRGTSLPVDKDGFALKDYQG
tara:strand:- start:217 stop:801 length:585 start_codon:yes stop_codon:yes gene_type:complete